MYPFHILHAPRKVFEVIGKELDYLLSKAWLHFLVDLNLLIGVVGVYGYHVEVIEVQVVDDVVNV